MNTADREAGSDYSRGNPAPREPQGPILARHTAAPKGDPPGPRDPPPKGPRSARDGDGALARLGRDLGRVPQRGHELAATVSRLLLAAGLGGAILLAVSDFATLYTVSAIGVTRLTVAGHDQHHYALVVVGVVAALMLIGAAGEARPPLFALVVLGIIALVIGPISDAGVVGSAGVIGEIYDNAIAHAGAGYHLELVGAVLLLISSAGLLLLSMPAPSPRSRPGGPRSRPGGPRSRPGGPRSRPGGPRVRPGGPRSRPGAGTGPPATPAPGRDGGGDERPRAAWRSGRGG